MCDNDRCCFVLNGRIEHFSGMYKTLIECSDTDRMGSYNSAGTIEGYDDEVFAVEMMILFKMSICSACRSDDRIVFDMMIP